jgi:trehalose 6-phosphate synthase/phosphatase
LVFTYIKLTLAVTELGLAAEHGFLYRYNSINNTWEKMLNDFNSNWRIACLQHLEPYTERCEGSFIEVKEASVVWQYRDCDIELGKAFAKLITLDLESTFRQLNIINGKGYVEVKPKGLSKGAFASFILKKEIKKHKSPDFILAIGDDTSDEEMFKYFDKKREEIKHYSKNVKIYTVCVGKKPSKAQAYLESPTDVKSLLESFVQLSIKSKLSQSTMNLTHLAMLTDTTELSSDKGIIFIPDELYNNYDNNNNNDK